MRINKISFSTDIFKYYNRILDVRSQNEYLEDKIPNSINVPVLNNKERVIIGLKYKENSFEARKHGASIINKNISKIINKNLITKKDKVLIYCWRGGLRSLSLYLVLKQIGYDVDILEGGYKSYRKFIVNFFDQKINKYIFNQIKGVTGVGKTLFLKTLNDRYQVLDLEGIAKHKGSILGDLPGKIQPSQKYFETLIFNKINNFNIKKVIWVESESIKIGKLSIPSRLWLRMDKGIKIKLESSIEERIKFILKDYKYFIKEPLLMEKAMKVLKKIIIKKDYKNIEKNLKNKDYRSFVENLITKHYDKAYKKTRSEIKNKNDKVIKIKQINKKEFLKIINESSYFA